MKHANKFIKSPLASFIVSTPLLFASSFVATPSAFAQDNGFYGGISIGESQGHISRSDLVQGFDADGRQVRSINKTDDDFGGKLLFGFDINPTFAVEFSYFDLGQYEFNTTLAPAQNMRGRASIEGIGVDLVTKMPITDNLTALLRAGMTHTTVAQSFRQFPLTPPTGFDNQTPRDNKLKAGLGLEYAFSDALSARAELEAYQLPTNQMIDNKATLATVGLVYRFGRTAAPAPVAPTHAPAPRPTPTPPPAPEPVSVTLESDVLFGFDDWTISSAGQQELDALLRQINELDFEAAIVVGHTDRIGSREYNLGLSERRANAVRQYLVNGGIPANRITARGVANDEATIPSSDCRNLGGGNAATIACLAPDRRVVIEIDGNREP
ncbi:MAG: OmpA family protein [Pseudohongiella sp.]